MQRRPFVPAVTCLLVLLSGIETSSASPDKSGIVEGGTLSASEAARQHFAVDERPISSGPSTVVVPTGISTDEGLLQRAVGWSQTYDIDQLYRSMQGPRSDLVVSLATSDEPELLWIKGVHAVLVDELGEPISQEFMCHVVGSIEEMEERNAALGLPTTQSNGLPRESRFATLSQGVYHKQYPPGFGLPILSTHLLKFTSQVLNMNAPEADVRVRHRIVIQYIRDADLKQPIRAITSSFANVMMLVEGDEGSGYFGIRQPDEATHGASCSVGQKADSDLGLMNDGHRKFTPHWILPPGETNNETLATELMDIRYDTTIHSIDVHLHPFAKWVELRDLTSGTSVFRSQARQVDEGIGLASVQTFRSEQGIPIFRDNQYAIVSAYDNTSGDAQDAMAAMYFGLYDKEFDSSVVNDSQARAARAASYREQNVATLLQTVREDPEDPVAHGLLALALFRQSELTRAAHHLRTAIRLNPNEASYRQALARVEQAMGLQSND